MSEGNPPVSIRRGDDGTTTLLGAGRLPKNDVRIALLDDVDEANAPLRLPAVSACFALSGVSSGVSTFVE
jgi:cob(I)alamin adenosyltransferase